MRKKKGSCSWVELNCLIVWLFWFICWFIGVNCVLHSSLRPSPWINSQLEDKSLSIFVLFFFSLSLFVRFVVIIIVVYFHCLFVVLFGHCNCHCHCFCPWIPIWGLVELVGENMQRKMLWRPEVFALIKAYCELKGCNSLVEYAKREIMRK